MIWSSIESLLRKKVWIAILLFYLDTSTAI